MSQVTLPSSWALLLCACAERWEPSCSSFRLRFGRRKCRRMQNTTSVNLHLRPFPAVMCFQSSNRLALPLPDGHSGQDRFLTNAAGGTPATASHARMTMTVAGFPLYPLRRLLHLSRGALRHPTHFLLFLSASPCVCQCPHAAIPDGISGHFRCRGKGKDGIRNTNFCRQNLHTSQAQAVFHRKNLLNLLP